MATGLVLFVVLCAIQLTSCKEIELNTQILAKLEELENMYATIEKQLEETRNGLEYLYNDTKNAVVVLPLSINSDTKREGKYSVTFNLRWYIYRSKFVKYSLFFHA